jgi:hypothetical protein
MGRKNSYIAALLRNALAKKMIHPHERGRTCPDDSSFFQK